MSFLVYTHPPSPILMDQITGEPFFLGGIIVARILPIPYIIAIYGKAMSEACRSSRTPLGVRHHAQEVGTDRRTPARKEEHH